MPKNDANLAEGEALYGKFCVHCHGATGQGDGLVGGKLPGNPPSYSDKLKNLPEGKIFHSITYGKGLIGSHASQLSQQERWKVVMYVQKLQNPGGAASPAMDSTTVANKTKNITIGLMAIGLVSIIAGFMTDHAPEGVNAEEYHHTRIWANLLVNGWFFTGIGLLATFFMALQYATEAAWAVVVKRVMEAISAYLPVGSVIMILILLAGQFHLHHLYHWMDPEVLDVNSPKYDEVIANKHGYFGAGFIKRSIEQDLQGGTTLHFKQMAKSAMFLVFFAVTSSTAAWDWMMSLDVHWFSTMYGWYSFAGMFISALITIILFLCSLLIITSSVKSSS